MTATPLLSLKGIRKQYPAVLANDNIALDVMPGQIHAILGENGAGKSTLMKIIYGAVQPDAGVIRFNGQQVQIRNPQQARALGISMVFQHFSLFDTLSVAQNVWLGLDKSLSLAEVTQRIRDKASAYGLDLEPERPVHTLSVGEMQRVEIIRALLCEPRLLNQPRCSPRKRLTSCLRCCANWCMRAAAFCTSATSCTKYAHSAPIARCCVAGGSVANAYPAKKPMPP